MENKLKPCPFCGGEAKMLEEYDVMIGKTYYFVECTECTGTIFSGEINEKEAIEAWNRRVNDDTL